jgi:hypothetical protein
MSEVVMQDEILFDTEYITVKYDAEHKVIHHTVHKLVEGPNLREALLAGTEGLKKYSACKWLSDDRLNGPLTPEDIEWGQVNWNAPTIAAGWKYWAVVVPTEVVSAGSMIPTINALFEYGLRMMVFDNLDKAFEWLDSVE